MREPANNDAKIRDCGTEMYVGKKGPVFELISCLRDARSNGKETISLFKYPIHVYVHFCPTWNVRDRGSATAPARRGRSVSGSAPVSRGRAATTPAPARGRRRARLPLVEVVPGRGLGRQIRGGGSKLRGERSAHHPVNLARIAGTFGLSGERITTCHARAQINT